MTKTEKQPQPGSGGHTTLSARTGVRLTIPELASLIVVAALAWGYLNDRFSHIDSRLDRLEDRIPAPSPQASRPQASRPVIDDHYAGGTGGPKDQQ